MIGPVIPESIRYWRSMGWYNIEKFKDNPIKYSPHIEVSPLKKKKYNQKLLRSWSINVRDRDNNICQKCGSRNRLHAHHIKPKAEYPDLMYEIKNGITLCCQCHAESHDGNIAKGLIGFSKL